MIDGMAPKWQWEDITRNLIIGGVVLVVICLVVVGSWKIITGYKESAKQKTIEIGEQQAKELAAAVSSRFKEIEESLKQLARADEVVRLFQTTDRTAMEQAAEQDQSKIPYVLKLRYLLPGKYQLDAKSSPPLGYASLNLLKKAEKSGQIGAEALFFGSPQEHIVIIERVVGESKELLGLVHASLTVAVLKELFEGIELRQAYAELAQPVGYKKTVILASVGNKSLKQGKATIANVNGVNWEIRLWVNTVLASPSIPIITIITALAFLLTVLVIFMKKKTALIAIVSGINSKMYSKPIEYNRKKGSSFTYEGAVRAITEGAHAGAEKVIPHLPKGKKRFRRVAPTPQGMLVEEIAIMPDRENEPAAKTEEPGQTVAPAVSEPASKPAVSEPASKPAVSEPASKPAVSEPASKPAVSEPASAQGAVAEPVDIDPIIFRSYDIRGVANETLTVDSVREIAKALGSMAVELGQTTLSIGCDCRESGQKLVEALTEGLISTGINVINIGMVPTPVLYFSTYHLATQSGVMVTGSHNPPEYNGLKIMLAGNSLSGDSIQKIRRLTAKREYTSGCGQVLHQDVNADYIQRITDDISVAPGNSLKIVVDCGNGVAGVLAPQLLKALGQDVIEMFCEFNGSFPNHHPDPSQPQNLQKLIERVQAEKADIGFAFDGDGDRLGIVDAKGNIIWPDRQMMLLAKDVLSRNVGAPVIYDVKCSRNLKTVIEESGGTPLMWQTGHSLIKGKMREVEAPLAGEMSGHIFFKERWYGFDDAIYTAARFIEIFANVGKKPTELFKELPDSISTPELRVPMPESEHGCFILALIQTMQDSAGGDVIDIDGVRIEYEDCWGLARPSNTSPNIILRFEGDNEAALERIKAVFKKAMLSVKSDVQLPF